MKIIKLYISVFIIALIVIAFVYSLMSVLLEKPYFIEWNCLNQLLFVFITFAILLFSLLSTMIAIIATKK